MTRMHSWLLFSFSFDSMIINEYIFIISLGLYVRLNSKH